MEDTSDAAILSPHSVSSGADDRVWFQASRTDWRSSAEEEEEEKKNGVEVCRAKKDAAASTSERAPPAYSAASNISLLISGTASRRTKRARTRTKRDRNAA